MAVGDKHWRYEHSEKGRARAARFRARHREALRAKSLAYSRSEHGRSVLAAYQQSVSGIIVRARIHLNASMKRHAAQQEVLNVIR